MKLLLLAMSFGQLTITSYQSVPNQTDSTPFHTSINEYVGSHGVAVSRDLLCPIAKRTVGTKLILCKRSDGCRHPERLHYYDWIYISGYGFKQVNDVMGDTKWDRKNKRRIPIRKAIDIWVRTYEEEKSVNIKKLNVWKVNTDLIGEY